MKPFAIRAALCAFIALTLATATAVAKPNFTGDWKMVPSKSDFGPIPAPETMTSKIDHKDPQLSVNNTQTGQQGEMKTQMTYTTDGTESTNEIRGNPVKTVAKWDGEALKLDSKFNIQGNDVAIGDRWTLSEDGKTLTMNRHIESPQGALDLKIVYEKQ